MAYEAGIITRQKLINSAKKLFYANGFEKTTIKVICEDAEVIRNVFFYYFKDKAALADMISISVNEKHVQAIEKELTEKRIVLNDLERCLYDVLHFFMSIMSDSGLLNFYSEILHISDDSVLGNDFYRNKFNAMYEFCGVDSQSKHTQLHYQICVSAPGNLMSKFRKGMIESTSEEICEYLIRLYIIPITKINNINFDELFKKLFALYYSSKVNMMDTFFSQD